MGQDNQSDEQAQNIYEELEPSEEELELETGNEEVEMPENYDLEDVYQDMEKVKKTALKNSNEEKKKDTDKMKDVERLVDQFEKAVEWKNKGYRERDSQIRMHHSYSGLAASHLVIFGFLYHGSGFVLLTLGLMYIILNEVTFLPDKENKFAEIASKHPASYLQGAAITFAMFLGKGYEVGKIEGITATIMQVVLGG